jgi:hypothetical protein
LIGGGGRGGAAGRGDLHIGQAAGVSKRGGSSNPFPYILNGAASSFLLPEGVKILGDNGLAFGKKLNPLTFWANRWWKGGRWASCGAVPTFPLMPDRVAFSTAGRREKLPKRIKFWEGAGLKNRAAIGSVGAE